MLFNNEINFEGYEMCLLIILKKEIIILKRVAHTKKNLSIVALY